MNYRSHTGLGAKHLIIEEPNLSEVAVSDDEWESLWEEWSMVGELKNKLLEDVGNIIDEALNAVDEGNVVVEFTNENVNSVKNVVSAVLREASPFEQISVGGPDCRESSCW